MKLSDVLIKPVVSEKVNKATEKFNRYYFIVDKKANKLEIKKAVEEFYGVTVAEVNTAVMPGKAKQRFTKAGFVAGKKPSYKKAIITVTKGEAIDLYANM
ncbi:large subunit ribosomal protein L23 [Chitinophaga niastensis]|jgi:large subunit ribosomal protein L23|uniref:Large ribosomal subunit protein uL23 n=1 Tax=Chitinophaga niastensis TaxID=536980 RepID=A0A2P8HMD1_CHINA|nr:50S ribosomal protein L23 [Chitinophaga niastensis]PSL47385.1 large subunit ribosomal protein L23 [Chitinophaga niastensis]